MNVLHDPASAVASPSNNSSDSQAKTSNPVFSNKSGTFLNPSTDYRPTTGYALGGGTRKNVPVYRDFNRNLITSETPNIGAIQQ